MNKYFLYAILLTPTLAFSQTADDASEREVMPPPDVIEPKIERREIKTPKIDTEDFEIGVFGGFMSVEDFGSNATYGISAAYHINERLFVEGTYAQSDTDPTSFELLSGGAAILFGEERDYSYFDLSLGFHLLPGESFVWRGRALTTSLYIIGGAGTTEFAGDDRFTVNVGFGTRVLINDAIALRLDARDHLFDIDVIGQEKTAHNLSLRLGLTTFF